MEIKILKTFELSNKDWTQIIFGFNSSFHRPTSFERLKSFYEGNIYGYSYHALAFEGDKLIGFNSIIPYKYLYKGEEINIGLSCSSFVLKEFRNDIFIFKDMYDALQSFCRKEQFIAFAGVPNKNSYKYSIVFLKSVEIGLLSYYALPIHISKVLNKPAYRFLDIFSLMGSCFIAFFSLCISLFNSKEEKADCHIKTSEDFYGKRFLSKLYSYYQSGNIRAWYRIVEENGVKTAYIMEFLENNIRTSKALSRIVWYIFRKEKIDLILFVGFLRLKQYTLIKLPPKREPRKLPLTYNLLDIPDKKKYESLSESKTWDFSLMNFDVR